MADALYYVIGLGLLGFAALTAYLGFFAPHGSLLFVG